jgi:hypothetical protein
VGETRLRQGSYTAGLDAFEQARRLLVPLDASVERSILLRNTADAYLGLNLYLEALAGTAKPTIRLRPWAWRTIGRRPCGVWDPR